MKSEMPKSLNVIEKAAESLAQASSSLKSDPYSKVRITFWSEKKQARQDIQNNNSSFSNANVE